MEHAKSRLSVHSRRKMMRDYEGGVSASRIARELGVSRTTSTEPATLRAPGRRRFEELVLSPPLVPAAAALAG